MISVSDTVLTISETLQTNAIVWMRSLPEGEMGPPRRILEDIKGLAITSGFPVVECAIRDRAELRDLFKHLTEKSEQGLRPVLHVDEHGMVADGLPCSMSRVSLGHAELDRDHWYQLTMNPQSKRVSDD